MNFYFKKLFGVIFDPNFIVNVMAGRNVRLARYSAAQGMQQILNELDSDSDSSGDDSGTDYEDNVSEQSEYSDEESAEDPPKTQCQFQMMETQALRLQW